MAARLDPRLRRYTDETVVLDVVLEGALVWGRGPFGLSPELRTLADWRRHWGEWRSVIEPKVAEFLPGYRAFAAYVCGELPERDVLQHPPRSSDHLRIYVPGDAGAEGRWHHRYPPPFMQTEPQWLHENRIVGAAEWKRYREARMRDPEFGLPHARNDYRFEVGLYL
jgi:hypothetical protein